MPISKTCFVKDLRFHPKAALTPTSLQNTALQLLPHASAAFWRFASHVTHVFYGAQMWVAKEVSDDLQASDIDDPDFGDIVWPHEHLEVYFEDPALPSFLLQHGARLALKDHFCKLAKLPLDSMQVEPSEEEGYADHGQLVDLLVQTPEGAIASVTLSHKDMNSYASGGDVPDFHASNQRQQLLNTDLDPAEELELRKLALLAFKVLLFATSEGFEPRTTDEQPTKKQGGKAGYKDRPRTKRLIVEYLPHHRVAKKKAAAEARGSHAFRGRRGHWRVYRHDRYKAMRGVRQFIPPVLGPDGTIPSRQFRVTKPKP